MFLYYVDLAWRSIRKTPIMSLLMVLAISVGIGIFCFYLLFKKV